MTTIEVRGDPTTIDAPWLTRVLETGGVARGATVTEVGPLTFVGTGQMGRSVRFPLVWDRPEGRPATVVGKFPTDDPPARTNAFQNGSYLKEHTFYTRLRPTVDIRVPEVWGALYDGPGEQFVLIMEDLAESEQGDQFEGLTVDRAALAVEQAVALHAPRWGDPVLAAAFEEATANAGERLQGLYQALVEPALERLGPHLADEDVALARAFGPRIARWAGASDTPRTLAHMDFRPDNLLFGTTPSAPPLVVVDWQTMTCGAGGNDLAYLIGGSFEPEDRARVERDLVDDYRTRLEARGVEHDPDTCWRDYRLGSLWGVLMSIIAAMLAEQTERGDRMFVTMLRRHAHQARDLEALELLDP